MQGQPLSAEKVLAIRRRYMVEAKNYPNGLMQGQNMIRFAASAGLGIDAAYRILHGAAYRNILPDNWKPMPYAPVGRPPKTSTFEQRATEQEKELAERLKARGRLDSNGAAQEVGSTEDLIAQAVAKLVREKIDTLLDKTINAGIREGIRRAAVR